MKSLHTLQSRGAVAALVLAVALPLPLPLWAQGAAQSPVVLQSVVEIERSIKHDDGTTTVERVPAKSAPPGQELVFTNTFRNQGKRPADNLVLTNPVPEHMTLTRAFGDGARLVYSADGGKTYAAPEALKVRAADGHLRPAEAKDYTHIRWTLQKSLPPGQSAAVGFYAVVK